MRNTPTTRARVVSTWPESALSASGPSQTLSLTRVGLAMPKQSPYKARVDAIIGGSSPHSPRPGGGGRSGGPLAKGHGTTSQERQQGGEEECQDNLMLQRLRGHGETVGDGFGPRPLSLAAVKV